MLRAGDPKESEFQSSPQGVLRTQEGPLAAALLGWAGLWRGPQIWRLRANLPPQVPCPAPAQSYTQFPKAGPALALAGLSRRVVRSPDPAAALSPSAAAGSRRASSPGERLTGCNELKARAGYRGTSPSITAFLPEDFWEGLGRGLTGFPPKGPDASSSSGPQISGPWRVSARLLSSFCLLPRIPGSLGGTPLPGRSCPAASPRTKALLNK